MELLILNTSMINTIGEVTSKDIFSQNSTTFKTDGLFSTEIFGEIGSPERLVNYGYIDLTLDCIHPLIYRHLSKLKSLYKDIMLGNRQAIFDTSINDFVEVPKQEGETGITFFLKHYDVLTPPQTDSNERKELISFIKKYKLKDIKINKYLVIPAGLRDYTKTESGKELEDEINNLYRKTLTIANTAGQFKDNQDDNPFLNNIKIKLQKSINEIYDYIENILEGKEGYAAGKWAKRRLSYGTRNVLTSYPLKVNNFKDKNRPKATDSVIGIYQYLKAVLPITINKVRSKFLDDIFSLESVNSFLINKKTLEKEIVTLSEKTRSTWLTNDGIESTVNKLKQDSIKSSPIIIDGHYLYLIYDDGETIQVLKDINDLDNTLDKKLVRPMTYVELFYLSIFDNVKNNAAYITRYPITGVGSIYPSTVYLKVSTEGRKVTYVTIHGEKIEIPDYVNLDKPYFNSMAVHPSHLDRLNGDMDGKS
jgi:hypothetical protein